MVRYGAIGAVCVVVCFRVCHDYLGGAAMKTLKDYFGEADRGDGRLFKQPWSTIVFEPIFRDKQGRWHGVDTSAIDDDEDNSEVWWENFECEPYTEPKKTETRWLWATADGKISSEFSTTPLSSYSQRAPLDSPKFDVKLEWSATQFNVGE